MIERARIMRPRRRASWIAGALALVGGVVASAAPPASAVVPEPSHVSLRNGYSFMCMAVHYDTAKLGSRVFQHECRSSWVDQRWSPRRGRLPERNLVAWSFMNEWSPSASLCINSARATGQAYLDHCKSSGRLRSLYERVRVQRVGGDFFQLRRRYRDKRGDRCLAIWHNFDNGAPVFEAPCNPGYREQHWQYWASTE